MSKEMLTEREKDLIVAAGSIAFSTMRSGGIKDLFERTTDEELGFWLLDAVVALGDDLFVVAENVRKTQMEKEE